MDRIKSVLNLEELVFDKILFERENLKNDNEIDFSLEAQFSENQEEHIYCVTLFLKGKKEDEYRIEIALSGYFSIDTDENLNESEKEDILQKNTLAILMPYLRSEVSLLTAQPNVDCVVLPPFNINGIINKDNLVENK